MNPSKVQRSSRIGWLAWIIGGIIIAISLVTVAIDFINRNPYENTFKIIADMCWRLSPIVFAVLASLILTRQPHNVIGWLLMMPALSSILPAEAYVSSFTSAPARPPFTLLLALWYSNWSWLLLIFPILFIPVLYPTGRPPSPRWRWLIIAGLLMCAIFLFLVTFSQTFEVVDQGWSVANPVGFLSSDWWGAYFSVPWGVGLLTLTVLSVASLFIRYHRAAPMEREQIKWLLYACALFAATYIPFFWIGDQRTIFTDIWDIFFIIAILTIPAAITVAILRYRLWDIDLIIRRTLIYGGLTLTLALIYFGSVVLLQSLFQQITRGQSTIAIVLSTLLIAALFNPLRRRIQRDIDRRFYRRKYDAQRTLEAFAASLREEVELEQLTGQLLAVVRETMQPENISLWLRKPAHREAIDLFPQQARKGIEGDRSQPG